MRPLGLSRCAAPRAYQIPRSSHHRIIVPLWFLRQTAGIVFVGLVAISGQESVSLERLHADDIEAEFHEAAIKPTAHIAGLKANLKRLILGDAVDQPTSNILGSGITFALAEFLAVGVNDADGCRPLRHIEPDEIIV